MPNNTSGGKPLRNRSELNIRKSDLPSPARCILFALWTYADWYTGEIKNQISHREIASATGLGERTVSRYITLLSDLGWLEIIAPPMLRQIRNHESSRYVIHEAPERRSMERQSGGSSGTELVNGQVRWNAGEASPPERRTSSIRTINRETGAFADAPATGEQNDETAPAGAEVKSKGASTEEELEPSPLPREYPSYLICMSCTQIGGYRIRVGLCEANHDLPDFACYRCELRGCVVHWTYPSGIQGVSCRLCGEAKGHV